MLERYKCFIYEAVTFNERKERIEVTIQPRKNSHPICSWCHEPCSTYDKLKVREFKFVPIWRVPVVFLYRMRRVNCKTCGIKVEEVPWASGKSPITRSLAIFLSGWARRLSWQETAECFCVNWRQVFTSVEYVVSFGLNNRVSAPVSAIGADEIAYGKGHKYMTVVYQLCGSTRRLLYVGRERTTTTLSTFFKEQGDTWCSNIGFACTDMWKPYLKAIREHLPNAVNILDRFHIVAKLNKAVDKVRRTEQVKMKKDGYEEVLKNSKYCFLKNPENLTEPQGEKLKDLLKYDLKSVRAYRLREEFQFFWSYKSPCWAEWFLKKWCTRANRSKLEPIKKFVKTVRRHEGLILNWFKAKKMYNSGAVEGMNRKINLITRRAYGFKSFETLRIALFHTLGDLPEPEVTHRF